MVKMGKLFRRNYGDANLGRGSVEYQKPRRQISLDEAIKLKQKQDEQRKQARRERIAGIGRSARNIFAELQETERTIKRAKTKSVKRKGKRKSKRSSEPYSFSSFD